MGKILVSDRARNVKTLLAKILSDDGHDVIDTSHGPEVLEKAYHEHPDLIIMDLMMQGMDGFEVMGRLRDNLSTETIPVIMMSASSKGESTALRLGAATYMIKPLQPGAVKVAVRAALRDSENATDNTVRRSSRNATEESAPGVREM